tara:strand:- start:659 stop:1714 length:1056 start_codon:yes stop_codon:yes gene_type:complete
MRLSIYLRKYVSGGGEKMKIFLSKELKKHNFKITIFTHSEIVYKKLNQNFNVILMKKYKNFVFQFFSDLVTLIKVTKKNNTNIQILFGFSFRFMILTLLGLTKSIVYPVVDPLYYKKRFLFYFRSLFSYFFANGIVFQTKTIRNRNKNWIKKKSIVIQNPIMHKLLEPVKKRKNKIVSVGRLSKEKNFDLLLDVFESLNLREYKLHIYGDGPLKKQLIKKVSFFNSQNNISFEGYTEDIIKEISDAKIFVLCSNFEGQPNVLIEAMSMGIPSISTNFPSGGAAELITNGFNGILIPTNDKNKLNLAITELINNESLYNYISINSLQIRKKLNKDLIIKQWVNYINEILNNE